MKPYRITPPESDVVSIEEFKAHIRMDAGDADEVVDSMLEAATAYLDGYAGILGRCLVSQTWRQDFMCWDRRLRLPFPNVSSTTVTYRDSSGEAVTVDPDEYELIEEHCGTAVVFKPGFAFPALWTSSNRPLSVDMVAGYGAAAEVPRPLRMAILMLAEHWYDHREASGDHSSVNRAFNALIGPYRRVMP